MAWCLALLQCLIGLSEATAQQGWSVQQFTAENGLPQNSVASLAFDSSGYLWITTEGGLVRYDGRSMRVFSTRTDTVLRDDRMRYLLMDRS
ncbi:MAG: two-component regulator propeller domain-containing protein, partial [Flavobacteriales bacterium]